jgi:hypothetical protein
MQQFTLNAVDSVKQLNPSVDSQALRSTVVKHGLLPKHHPRLMHCRDPVRHDFQKLHAINIVLTMSRERGNTILVGLKLTSLDGKVEREMICTTAITVFNLHKVIQWSLFPSKGDDTVAATVGDQVPKQSFLLSLHPWRQHVIKNPCYLFLGVNSGLTVNHPQVRAENSRLQQQTGMPLYRIHHICKVVINTYP